MTAEPDVKVTEPVAIEAMHFVVVSAMALVVPDVLDHPNRMPFSGVLTKIGEPSDYAPEGSGGKRVLVTREAAEEALPSILGMGVNVAFTLSGHDPQKKVGIIDSAVIDGDEIKITGFIYAADFPEVAAEIKRNKNLLGFSFEAANLYVANPGTDPLTIIKLTFTGAAILYKDKAAYTTTSLAASAAQPSENFPMTKEELAATLAEALKPINDKIETIEAGQAAAADALKANANVQNKVEPHAAALEACASGMEADGVGCAANFGHASELRKMASSMRADAAKGVMPSIYRDHNYGVNAGRDTAVQADPASSKELTDLKSDVASLTTKLTDALAAAASRSPEPERKTLSPQISALLSRANIGPDSAKDGKYQLADINKALASSTLDTRQRMEVKVALERNDLIAKA